MWLHMLTSRVTSANEVFLENITVVPAGALTGKLLEIRQGTVAGDKNLNIVGDGNMRPSPSSGNTTLASSRVGI